MIPLQVESSDVDRELRRRGRDLEREGRKAAKTTSGAGAARSAVAGGAIFGAVAGVVIGALSQNDATSNFLQLIVALLVAALLPVIRALFPLLEAVGGLAKVLLEELVPAATKAAEATRDTIEKVKGFLVKGRDVLKGKIEGALAKTPETIARTRQQQIAQGQVPGATSGIDVTKFFDTPKGQGGSSVLDFFNKGGFDFVSNAGQDLGVLPKTPNWLEGFFQ